MSDEQTPGAPTPAKPKGGARPGAGRPPGKNPRRRTRWKATIEKRQPWLVARQKGEVLLPRLVAFWERVAMGRVRNATLDQRITCSIQIANRCGLPVRTEQALGALDAVKEKVFGLGRFVSPEERAPIVAALTQPAPEAPQTEH